MGNGENCLRMILGENSNIPVFHIKKSKCKTVKTLPPSKEVVLVDYNKNT